VQLALFNTPPAKVKDGYANFAVSEPPLKLVLIENPGKGGTINHLGVEVATSDTVHAEIARLAGECLFTRCCRTPTPSAPADVIALRQRACAHGENRLDFPPPPHTRRRRSAPSARFGLNPELGHVATNRTGC